MKMAKVGLKKRRLPIKAAQSSLKRRNINNTSQDLNFSPSLFVDQLKSTSNGATPSHESPSSSCSTNGSPGLHQESVKFLDLKVQVQIHEAQAETSTCNCGDQIRSEMSLSRTNSQEVESVEKPTTQANLRCVIATTQRIMPTELELEEFFAAAEKDIQKRFSDKYNFDIVKDMPLEGRYEWVQLKP